MPAELKIRYEPQTCAQNCDIPDCHLSHGETWWVGDAPYFSRATAEAALREAVEWETPSALTGKTPAQEHDEWDALRALADTKD